MTSILAEFESDQGLLDATIRMHGLGYDAMEAYTPFPMPALDPYLPPVGMKIPRAVLIAGMLGAASAYLIEWASVQDFPLRVGGFSLNSLPAFIPIMFETTILAGAITAFVAVFVRSGLLQWWNPMDEVDGFERSSIDRFFLLVSPDRTHQSVGDQCRMDLAGCQPLRIISLECAS